MDKKNLIIRQAERLPIQIRKEIAVAIIQSIDRDESAVDARTRFAELIRVAEAVFGYQYNPDRRKACDAYIRNVVASAMRGEGYTFSSIAKAMGRNTSSIIAMRNRADDMAAGFLGAEIKEKYNQFIHAI